MHDLMLLTREPETRYFVEVKVPQGTNEWLKSSTNHTTQEDAERSLTRMESHSYSDTKMTRRVGAEVVLRYGLHTMDQIMAGKFPKVQLTATWSSDTLAYHAPHRKFTIPLDSPQVGDIELELSEDDLDRLIVLLNETRDAAKEATK